MRRGFAAGLLAGTLWGVVARMFMRLLSDDPQFSWEGTLGIIGMSAVAGALVGLVHGARLAGRSRWWRLAALPGLLLFAGPGSLLLPAAVGMAVVLLGRPWARVVGVLLVAVTPVVLLTMPPTVHSGEQLAGLALMLLCTAPLGWALGEVVRRWRPRPVPTAQSTLTPAWESVAA
jgi:drug/metabolite transporter (DMT)-like permease